MGFVSFLKFVVKYVDVLAWPLLAVVYPLWASIRAIESDSSSDHHPKKLVAYWILFSLVFLFENAFVKLLEWLPFWPYLKLIMSCWLVIPNFDGAFYVYEHFLRPCLFMDTKVNQFKDREEFLPMDIKRYVKENGPETSEVASQVKLQSTNYVGKNLNAVEMTEKKDVNAAKQVNLTEPDQKDEKIEEISEPVGAGTEICQTPVSKRVQKEWTCAICQVTTQSELTLNSHLRGRRHKETCAELNAKNQQPKPKVSYASKLKMKEPENQASTSRQKRRPKTLQGQQENCVERKQSLWWCKICNRSCNSKHDMDCHLNGSKHLAQAAQMYSGS